MRLEMIGMQFDQAGHDQITAGVLAACRRVTFFIPDDTAIHKSDPAALDHTIRQNDSGVAKHGLGLCRSHLRRLPSCGSGERCDIDDPVGDQMAYLIVMDDGDHGDTLAFLLVDQFDHHGAIGCVERSGRFIQQQDRQIGFQSTDGSSDIHVRRQRRLVRGRPTCLSVRA